MASAKMTTVKKKSADNNFYDRLLTATATQRNEFLSVPVLRAGVAGAIDLATYIGFLTQAYHHVSQTVPLLMACGERLPARLNWMQKALAEYISEEIGHEEWILDDISGSGGDWKAVRNGRPSFATEQMIAYAWYTILRGNPVGFFGMVLVLEGTSVALATQAAGALQQNLGLSPKCFKYLTSHGSLDISHMQNFQSLMNQINDPQDQQAIIHCAQRMYRLYGDIFRSLSWVRSKQGE